jgi:ABC-2 type transport system permease protein
MSSGGPQSVRIRRGPLSLPGLLGVSTVLRLGLRRGDLELRQFLRSRESVVFTLAFPLFLLVVFGAIFDADFLRYFVAGMLAAALLTVGFQSLAIQIPIERDKGALKRLRGTPMPPAAYFLGKVALVLVIGAAETALMLACAFGLYGVPVPNAAQWLIFAWVAALGITACTLCGIAFSSLVRTARGAPAMVTPVALVLQFISGVFFLFTRLPEWLQRVAAIFPLKWMTQGMRAAFLPPSFASREAAGSWELGRIALVLTAWCVAGLVLCLLTFRWSTRRDG